MLGFSEVISGVTGLFKPLAKLVDDVHTSDEEKLTLKNALVGMQNEVTMGQLALASKAMDLEAKALQAQQAVITAEANSGSWIAANWRPITMLNFVGITTLNSLGFIEMDAAMSENYFTLVQIGLGGYVLGRSGEKIADKMGKS